MELVLSYKECPKCGKWYTHTGLMSYTIFGGQECWSDGKYYQQNMSEYSFMPFSKCMKCGSFFWFDDCRELREYEIKEYQNGNVNEISEKKLISDFLMANPDFPDERRDLNLDYPPAGYWENFPEFIIPDYISILENGIDLNIEREIYIRTKLWQHCNDLLRFSKFPIFKHIRHSNGIKNLFNFRPLKYHFFEKKRNKKLYKEYQTLFVQNLNQLLELYKQNTENEDSMFSEIEIHRELGNFQEAKSIIHSLDNHSKNNNKSFLRKSRWMIALKSTKAFKIR